MILAERREFAASRKANEKARARIQAGGKRTIKRVPSPTRLKTSITAP